MVQHLHLFLHHLPNFTVVVGCMSFPCIQSQDRISHYRAALPLLNQGERFMQKMDRKNYRGGQQKIQQKFPLPICCSLPSVLALGQEGEGELLSGYENWASLGSSVWGLLSCISPLCSLCLGTLTPSTFGNVLSRMRLP